ncbi:copper resistance D family protein [Pelagibius sp.]|uniref:copper resistance D family protein n=1 Tax=Pelagibius sp. TaxID=1931238 RepID=UPI00260F47EF|nr:CopD family protein [Pelagibius sp.]
MTGLAFSAVEVLQLVAKILAYAGSLGAVGALAFIEAFRDLLRDGDLPPLHLYAAVLLLAGLLASLLMLFGTVAMLNGLGLIGGFDWELWGLIAKTPAGDSVWIRVAGLLVLLAGLLSVRLRRLAVVLGGLCVAASFGLVGHVQDEPQSLLLQGLLVLHLLGVGLWIGSLWPLLSLARVGEQPRVARIMARFGRLAVVFVGTLLAAGVALAWLLLEDIGHLAATPYGRLLLIKIGLVTLLLGLAALNKLRLVPALAAGERSASLRLRRSIRLEITMVLLILTATGLLTTAFSPS